MELSSSLEDYLETIYELKLTEETIRITDISRKLGVEKPSVYTAIKKLKKLNLVLQEKYSNIILTQQGEVEAKKIRNKHDTITRFLMNVLGLKAENAEDDACKIEHVISNQTLKRMSHLSQLLDDPEIFDKNEWLTAFNYFMETGDSTVIKKTGIFKK